MIDYTPSDIVSFLGDTLFDIDHTPLGVDQEIDQMALEDSMKYFIASWLSKRLEMLCHKQTSTRQKRPTYSYFAHILRKLSRRNNRLFKVVEKERNWMTFKVQTSPLLWICLSRMANRKCAVSIWIAPTHMNHYGGDYKLSPRQLSFTLTNIENIISEKRNELIASGMRCCLPSDLVCYYKRGKLTKNMGHSFYSSGEYMYGHEVRLRASSQHDFAMAYITDYLENPDKQTIIFNNATKAYQLLLHITEILPQNVSFECVHADDGGVDFTSEEKLSEHFLIECDVMDRITEYRSEGKHLNRDDYAKIIGWYHLQESISAEDLQHKYEEGMSSRLKIVGEIEKMLANYKDKIIITPYWDKIYIYTIPEREYLRECFLTIPYQSDLAFLMQFDKLMEVTSELLMQYDKDWESSVGLLPVEK